MFNFSKAILISLLMLSMTGCACYKEMHCKLSGYSDEDMNDCKLTSYYIPPDQQAPSAH